ncbi:MAG: FAD-dependent oxidoreductase [Phycisphaeraceae bacterium]|nr:FAD-dependent oxidoreductase [Phycisphaeraceae bacterium]
MRSSGLNHQKHTVDVCVIGGGMAGLCAAIAAARNGARTILVHDRPVLGGNASSEIRMWICGAHGRHNKETGILEEIQLLNLHRNPGLNYSIWDGVLYEKAFFQPGLTTLLNASCADATMDAGRIESIRAWQLTSQTWHTIEASYFIDCSGDSILAALTPAAHRWGREAREEFGEDIEPPVADHKTMGNSLLIQAHRGDEPQPFVAPPWAYRFDGPEDLEHRVDGVSCHNFWWLEIGGLDNTIADAEAIRHELMRIAYGVWDYLKNRCPEREKTINWGLHWLGALPGKRENRRYEGDHIMTQHDVEGGGRFDDVVAYGGWTMDDHHPAGLLYPGKPTVFHPAPTPYGIPYRCLYSRNIDNLLFAGRNISVTHAALSSTRVMATCAVIGQAAGTAAAMCSARGCTPRSLWRDHIRQLQQLLMDQDCFLPGVHRAPPELTRVAKLDGPGRGLEKLHDGIDRDREGESHAWVGDRGAVLTLRWDRPVFVGGLRLIADSNLNNDKRMPYRYPVTCDRIAMPGSLLRAFTVEALGEDGTWERTCQELENVHRLIHAPVGRTTRQVRIRLDETWGDDAVRLFGLDALETMVQWCPVIPSGPRFSELRAAQRPSDLAPPAKELDPGPGKRTKAGA